MRQCGVGIKTDIEISGTILRVLIYRQYILTQWPGQLSLGKISSFQQIVQEKLGSHMENGNLDVYPVPYEKLLEMGPVP